jgi:hypothetical protein
VSEYLLSDVLEPLHGNADAQEAAEETTVKTRIEWQGVDYREKFARTGCRADFLDGFKILSKKAGAKALDHKCNRSQVRVHGLVEQLLLEFGR